jgi:hypothetical protein
MRRLGPLGLGDAVWMAGLFLLMNLGEWTAHRGLPHHRMFPCAVHHRHVVEHHAFFTYDDMAVGWDDVRRVLFSTWALPISGPSGAPTLLLVRL